MPTKKKIIIKKKKQIIKVKQSQKVKVVVNVGNKSKTRVKRKAAAPQQKQPIIINTHVINQPAAQQYDQQQQLQQANQQKQQNYEELLNVPPVERNKLFPEKLKQKEYFENELTSKLRQPKKIAIRQPIMPVVQENELESMVDDTNATKIDEFKDEIKKPRSRTAITREQLDVAEAKNSYLNLIKQPEVNPREVDEAKPEPKQLSKRQQDALIKREAKALIPKKLTKREQRLQENDLIINKQKVEESNRLRENDIDVSKLNVKELQKIAKLLDIQRSVGSGKKGEKLKRQNLVVLIQGMQANIQRDANSKMGAV
jgi:hypothetical protein